ncbi:hypothetical protein HELRODRAFT_123984, partial [Helobdella robusta]|uniref:Calcineurin-like phosphoesterase domain-containing protein n=1 Tax=Helobdella robusta TaxID=6412 RepID=T1EGZ8_HELRO
LIRFGVISDLHYADHDPHPNFEKTYLRHYRRSLQFLQNAVKAWELDKVGFVIDLGDVIDGKNVAIKQSLQAFEKILNVYKSLNVPDLHVVGNHELYNFSRSDLLKMNAFQCKHSCLNGFNNFDNSGFMYYCYEPHPSVKCIVLDMYEISLLGNDVNSPEYKQALGILSINPNQDLNSAFGLEGTDERFVKYNGGISKAQLQWLDVVLEDSEKKKQMVIMFGHCPLQSNYPMTLCWNYDEILAVMHQHKCVQAYCCGHAHEYYYTMDSKGIHHLTLPGVIKLPTEISSGHLTVDVYNDKL